MRGSEKMSNAEVHFDRRISKRRKRITEIDGILNFLNLEFPGERKKAYRQRDPIYLSQRCQVLDERRILSFNQHLDRINRAAIVKKKD